MSKQTVYSNKKLLVPTEQHTLTERECDLINLFRGLNKIEQYSCLNHIVATIKNRRARLYLGRSN